MSQIIARRCVFGLIALLPALLMASAVQAQTTTLSVKLAPGTDSNGEPSYTATVKNTGAFQTVNLAVTYTLPHFELPISPSPGGGCLFTPGAFHLTVVCVPPQQLAAGDSHDFVISVHPTDTSPQDVTAVASADNAASMSDFVTSTITAVGLTEMQVTMDSTNPGKVGEAMTFHVTVVNIQDDDAQNVFALLTLPKFMTWVSATKGCTKGTNVVCKIGRLSPGTGKTVTITVIPTVSGWNQATAGLRLTTPDRDFTNNSAATAFWVNP